MVVSENALTAQGTMSANKTSRRRKRLSMGISV